MIWNELADTLTALIEGIQAPPDSGLIVTEAILEVPLEVHSGLRDGKLVFFGNPPHTRWKSGVLPQVHKGHLRISLASMEETALYSETDGNE